MVKDYLIQQSTYTKHLPAVQNFPTRKVIGHGLNHQWQADLADMRNLSQYNDNYNYILTVIDMLSKYAFAIPIKRKTGDNVVEAFKSIIEETIPRLTIQTNHGAEFMNKKCPDLFKSHNSKWFETYNTVKTQIVERFN